MPINVGDLLKERDRLNGVIEEAKIARARIRQINVLVAMYGDQSNVTVKPPKSTIKGVDSRGRKIDVKPTKCPKCPGKTFVGKGGLTMHNSRVHGKLKGNPRLKAVS